jgi:hypothetical protein
MFSPWCGNNNGQRRVHPIFIPPRLCFPFRTIQEFHMPKQMISHPKLSEINIYITFQRTVYMQLWNRYFIKAILFWILEIIVLNRKIMVGYARIISSFLGKGSYCILYPSIILYLRLNPDLYPMVTCIIGWPVSQNECILEWPWSDAWMIWIPGISVYQEGLYPRLTCPL